MYVPVYVFIVGIEVIKRTIFKLSLAVQESAIKLKREKVGTAVVDGKSKAPVAVEPTTIEPQ